MIILPIVLALLVNGCGGTRTFNDTARGGDTVAVQAGWKHSFTKDSITVEIYSPPWSPGNTTPVATYGPGDPKIRGVTNAYIDPLSSLVVSRETGQDLTQSAQQYASSMGVNFTGKDRGLVANYGSYRSSRPHAANRPRRGLYLYIYRGD